MKRFITIFLTVWTIFPGCDPGWRYRATVSPKSAYANLLETKVEAHYFGGSKIEIAIKNISKKEVIVQPLYAYAHSISCPGKTHISTRVQIKTNAISETYYLFLPDSHYAEASKDQFDMRELWGKPGSKLSMRPPIDQDPKESTQISELQKRYVLKPGETIAVNHSIPTFSCKTSTMGYPSSQGQIFDFVVPLIREFDTLVITVEPDNGRNANGS